MTLPDWLRRAVVCLALIGATLCAAASADAAKPQLRVYHSPGSKEGVSRCGPCNQFWADWDTDKDGLRTTLQHYFEVLDGYETARPVPAFKVGRCLFVGYSGPINLYQRLGLRRQTPPTFAPEEPAREPSPPPAAPAADQEARSAAQSAIAAADEARSQAETAARAVEQLAAQITSSRREIDAQVAAVRSDAQQRTAGQQAEAEQLAASLSDTVCRQDALEQALDTHNARINDVSDQTADQGGQLAAIMGRLRNAAPAAFSVLQLAGLVAAGGVTGGAGVVGINLLLNGISYLRRRRRQRSGVSGQPIAKPTILTTQAPPAPQVVIPETRYTQVEVDSHAEAFAWAKQQFAIKYPGSTGSVETMQSLIDQYLSSKRASSKAA